MGTEEASVREEEAPEQQPEQSGEGNEAQKVKPKDLEQTSAFKKGYKRMRSRGADTNLLKSVIEALQSGEELDEKYHDHQLEGKWKDSRDCHIQPDWVLIYRITEDAVILQATGTHSDLFK